MKEVKREALEAREERGEQRLRFKGRLEGSQLAGLERAFSQRPYPSQEEREQLAGLLHLPTSVVRNWFQNKRSKGKEVRPKEEVERIAVSRDVTMVKAEPLAVTPPTIPAAAPSLGTFSFNFSSRREAYQAMVHSTAPQHFQQSGEYSSTEVDRFLQFHHQLQQQSFLTDSSFSSQDSSFATEPSSTGVESSFSLTSLEDSNRAGETTSSSAIASSFATDSSSSLTSFTSEDMSR